MSDRAAAFDDLDVARCYAHRPPYAPALYEFLLGLVPRKQSLVDLGCGPGKIAAALAGKFTDVVAIDPAIAMIETAKATNPQPNIRWLHTSAEEATLPDDIDLVTAGTSIHWMKHEILFPKLAGHAPLVAVITGDAPLSPPWFIGETAFLTKWLARLHGRTFDRPTFIADGRIYEPWLDIAGRREFTFNFLQSIADYVACQHSRASWTRSRMGAELVVEFDRELEELLRPFARDGIVSFDLTSELVWGAPRKTARG